MTLQERCLGIADRVLTNIFEKMKANDKLDTPDIELKERLMGSYAFGLIVRDILEGKKTGKLYVPRVIDSKIITRDFSDIHSVYVDYCGSVVITDHSIDLDGDFCVYEIKENYMLELLSE